MSSEKAKKALRDALKDQFLLMLNEINAFHDLPIKVVAGLSFSIPAMKKSSSEAMITKFVKYVLPHKVKISNRERDFFIDEKEMFFNLCKDEDVDGVPMDREYVDVLTEVWASPIMTEERRNTIWRFFDVFIELMEQYKKKL